MRYRLRTLLLVAGLAPALLAGISAVLFLGWTKLLTVFDHDAVSTAIQQANESTPWDGKQPLDYDELERLEFGTPRKERAP